MISRTMFKQDSITSTVNDSGLFGLFCLLMQFILHCMLLYKSLLFLHHVVTHF